jgi:hypothetical protein
MKTKAVILFQLVLLVSCNDRRMNFDGGIIPPVPVNFTSVNSTYDDYNSDLEIIWNWKHFSLIFSTNRYSYGQQFDLTGYEGRIEANLLTGEFEMRADARKYSILDTINSQYNELGPYFTHDLDFPPMWKKGTGVKRFFYSTDINGNSDIYCCYYTYDAQDFVPDGDPVSLTAINTPSDEGYLTIHDGEGNQQETCYFMSDYSGNYDIWRAVSDKDKLIDQSTAVTLSKVERLSSGANDKCPFICGNMIVFTSDREGGYGGFDLYYSVYNGGEWSAPVNFGSDINTEFDEYRPVVVSTKKEGFLNDLMIFSSNRPGGYGLFDLYYVGIKRSD